MYVKKINTNSSTVHLQYSPRSLLHQPYDRILWTEVWTVTGADKSKSEETKEAEEQNEDLTAPEGNIRLSARIRDKAGKDKLPRGGGIQARRTAFGAT